jgi:hypothetical protein
MTSRTLCSTTALYDYIQNDIADGSDLVPIKPEPIFGHKNWANGLISTEVNEECRIDAMQN